MEGRGELQIVGKVQEGRSLRGLPQSPLFSSLLSFLPFSSFLPLVLGTEPRGQVLFLERVPHPTLTDTISASEIMGLHPNYNFKNSKPLIGNLELVTLFSYL